MSSIYFDDQASENLGLIFVNATIETPAAKVQKVSVPYSDGDLDLTEYYGVTKFENRLLTMGFYCDRSKSKTQIVNDVINALHGKVKKIVLPSDPDFYYVGRCSVSATEISNLKKCAVTITADCEPYKMKTTNTIVTKTGSETVTLHNLRKRVVPSITTTAETRLVFGQTEVNLSAGTWTVPELELSAGANSITVTSTGTTTFTYREGSL